MMKNVLERSSILAAKFTGPYLVAAKEHGNKFKIFDPNQQFTEVVHADRLKNVKAPLSDDNTLPEVNNLVSDNTDTSLSQSPTNVYRQKLRSATKVNK